MELLIKTLDDLNVVAQMFIKNMGNNKIFAFYGNMGVGKTTFIKTVCKQLGVTDVVNSPSFAIINEYNLPKSGKSIFHFDFYRIKKLSEVYDIGYEDYFFSGNICFLEWPELIENLLPEDTIRISITLQPNQSRILKTF